MMQIDPKSAGPLNPVRMIRVTCSPVSLYDLGRHYGEYDFLDLRSLKSSLFQALHSTSDSKRRWESDDQKQIAPATMHENFQPSSKPICAPHVILSEV